jgi:hypothetical protein
MDSTRKSAEAKLKWLRAAALSAKLNDKNLVPGTPEFEHGLRIVAEQFSDEQWADLEAQLAKGP